MGRGKTHRPGSGRGKRSRGEQLAVDWKALLDGDRRVRAPSGSGRVVYCAGCDTRGKHMNAAEVEMCYGYRVKLGVDYWWVAPVERVSTGGVELTETETKSEQPPREKRQRRRQWKNGREG